MPARRENSIFLNVCLGEEAKLDAAQGVLFYSSWATFPLIGCNKLRVQWGRWKGDITSTTYNCDFTFPMSFPELVSAYIQAQV